MLQTKNWSARPTKMWQPNTPARDAVDKLAVKIIKGGSGVWGPVPMPSNAQVSQEEAKQLVSWILTQK